MRLNLLLVFLCVRFCEEREREIVRGEAKRETRERLGRDHEGDTNEGESKGGTKGGTNEGRTMQGRDHGRGQGRDQQTPRETPGETPTQRHYPVSWKCLSLPVIHVIHLSILDGTDSLNERGQGRDQRRDQGRDQGRDQARDIT